MDAAAPDDWVFNGAPVDAAPTPAAAPVTQSLLPNAPPPSPAPTTGDISGGYHISKAPPPLPQESDESLLARAGIAEGGASVEGQTAVIRALKQRAAVSGKSIPELLTQPGQMQTYWNGQLQGVDPNSPAYQSALKIAQTATPSPGIDSWYSPAGIKKQGFGTPPFDPSTGTMIGGQMFGHGSGWGTAAAAAGTDDASWGKFTATIGAQPNSPAAATPGSKAEFNAGPQMGAMSQAAVTTFHNLANDPNRGIDPNASFGSAKLPYYVDAGKTAPAYPDTHWVDVNGTEHVNPGGMVEKAEMGLENVAQGALGDLGASASRLTAGGIAVDNPLYAAIAQGQGGPGALDIARAAAQGFQQEENAYKIRHYGDPTEPALRFLGQAGPSTAAALAVPEVSVPGSALEGWAGVAPKIASKLLTSSARGTAATATQVGANSAPVTQQLATGAIAGPVAEAAPEAAGRAGQLVRSLGVDPKTIPPETMTLANAAINEYGIPLRASQIGGTVNRNMAVQDSNLISTQFRQNANDQIAAWNKQIIKQAGAPDFASATPAAMSAAKTRTGAIYDDLSSHYNINDAKSLLTRLQSIYEDARGAVPEGELTPLAKQIENVRSLVQPDGTITGAGYHGLTDTGTSLDRLAGSDGPLSGYARDFRDAIDSSLRDGMSTADQARLDQANSQWKAMKAIEPLAGKAGATGMIPPASLLGRLNANRFYKGSLPYTLTGEDPMTDLARIGGLLKEPPNSNTAARFIDTVKRNALSGVIAGAAGGEAATHGTVGGLLHDPGLAIQLGVGAGLAKGAQMAGNALRGYQLGPGAGAALVGAKAPRSALGQAIGDAATSLRIPLSALAGIKLEGGGGVPVTANAQ